ncbi:hypothetical protein PB1_00450 [Bacillus methanolicus PB1]|uniref:Uncharacterized protein n=1 Tax=Bacillus methanolicus PB1 TaxID=997296 RepID=I3E4E8_BACMT|nr:hypothetical protein [Bacillus methanolicus]EIJ81369.1 hypothetical protein PB1_00450 [Bacillus methanolicus PB1]
MGKDYEIEYKKITKELRHGRPHRRHVRRRESDSSTNILKRLPGSPLQKFSEPADESSNRAPSWHQSLSKKICEEITERLAEFPIQINLYLTITQNQNPEQTTINDVQRSAVALKDSNAVENAISSAIAQDKSQSSKKDKALDDTTSSSDVDQETKR